MNTSLKVEDFWENIFDDVEFNHFDDFKKIELSVQLSALLVHAGKSRTEIAESLGVSRGWITKLLSGNSNPTLRTVYEFCEVLGYDFDLVFRKPDIPVHAQPWDYVPASFTMRVVDTQEFSAIQAQTANEVRDDMHKGNMKSMYFSFARDDAPKLNLVDVFRPPDRYLTSDLDVFKMDMPVNTFAGEKYER